MSAVRGATGSTSPRGGCTRKVLVVALLVAGAGCRARADAERFGEAVQALAVARADERLTTLALACSDVPTCARACGDALRQLGLRAPAAAQPPTAATEPSPRGACPRDDATLRAWLLAYAAVADGAIGADGRLQALTQAALDRGADAWPEGR